MKFWPARANPDPHDAERQLVPHRAARRAPGGRAECYMTGSAAPVPLEPSGFDVAANSPDIYAPPRAR